MSVRRNLLVGTHVLNVAPILETLSSLGLCETLKRGRHMHVFLLLDITHTIHGTGIFTYVWLKVMVKVGKYTMHGLFG